MAKPARNADPDNAVGSVRVFFVTTGTSMGRRLLQSERNAMLLVDVLRSCVAEGQFKLHDFVIMPDHIHLLVTVNKGMTIEKAMQLIKGRFSYRLKRECGYLGEVWQRGFSEERADDLQSFTCFQDYIAKNPVKAGLADVSGEYPYCFARLSERKQTKVTESGGNEEVPGSNALRG